MSFRCLYNKNTVNYNTGANAGSTTTIAFTLPSPPLMPGTVTGIILLSLVPGQTLSDLGTTLSHTAALTIGGTGNLTSAILDHFSGHLTLTFSSAPGQPVSVQASYTGQTIYKYVTDEVFQANCPNSNTQCSSRSSAYVPAITVCNQSL